jgi:histidine triad (HIT) family protein
MACIFCQIIAKSVPADIVHEDDDIIVFKDIQPAAAIHVLMVPKQHVPTVNDLDEAHAAVMGKLFLTAKHLAEQWNIVAQGYRLTVNVGRGGGQLIDHVHMHMMSGRQQRT